MDKRTHLMLLFCTLLFASFTFAANGSALPQKKPLETTFCDAPAPSNFRVTSRGPNFIDLAWDPVAPVGTHALIFFTRVAAGAWIPVDTFDNISGTSITLNDVAFETECRFLLSTNCASGERSIYQTELLPKIILELDVAGRTPVSPQPFSCAIADLAPLEWIGFRVTQKNGTPQQSNLFEFTFEGDATTGTIKIMRVNDDTEIFAANNLNNWPPPFLQAQSPFKMVRYPDENNDYENIGFVGATMHFAGKVIGVELCQFIDIDHPWNGLFDYTVLVANEVSGGSPIPNKENGGYVDSLASLESLEKFRAQSPFSETLSVFMQSSNQEIGTAFIRLLNTNGQIVFEQQVITPFGKLSFPLATIAAGMYILHIETNESVQDMKLLKID